MKIRRNISVIVAALVMVASATGCPTFEGSDFESPSAGQLVGRNISLTTFNVVNSALEFELVGAQLTTDPSEVSVMINGQVLPMGIVEVSNNVIKVPSFLADGRNTVSIDGADSNGNVFAGDFSFWNAPNKVSVSVLDEKGGVVSGAKVVAAAGDDPHISTTIVSAATPVDLNVPAGTIIYSASTSDGRFGTLGAAQLDGTVHITIRAMKPASTIDNNDFHLGVNGWEVGNAPVTLTPHANLALHRNAVVSGAASDLDLVLSTSGEGEQHISRTFNVSAGVKRVRVRYQFTTSEVPGGYFGTQYDDYFAVTIRTANGQVASEASSMNALGLAAFDASGATDWREVTLDVNPKGDTVEVDAAVANVADDLYDSAVVIDKIELKELAIRELELNDIDETPLTQFSDDQHAYFGGMTPIHGTITIEGDKSDELTTLELEIIENGAVVGTAELDGAVRGRLLKSFGDSESVSIDDSTTLFNLPAMPNAANAAQQVILRVHATAKSGDEATREFGPLPLLVRYQGANRFDTNRDVARGGDDWVKPSVRTVIEHYAQQITVGDISNMHGGSFLPDHASHRLGVDMDGHFPGYNQRNAQTAQRIIAHLNDAEFGSRIQLVFVTFEPNSEFAQTIQGVVLNDGRLARNVIRPLDGHTGHFHWRISE